MNVHASIIGTPIFAVKPFNRQTYFHSMENIGMSIGSRIKEARRDAKMTQQQLCAKVGIKQGTLSELETGESAGTTLIASFAAALHVNPLWLETGKGEKAPFQSEPDNLIVATPEKHQTIAYPDAIQEVIDLMMRTDERGRLKIKLAAVDAYELHNSHISRTQTIALDDAELLVIEKRRRANEMGKSLIDQAAESAFEDERHSKTSKRA